MAGLVNGFTFHVMVVGPVSGTVRFYPYVDGDQYFILKTDLTSLVTLSDTITATNVYKFVYYSALPTYGVSGFIMIILNVDICPMIENVNTYLFYGNGGGFIPYNIHLPTLSDGQIMRIVDANGGMSHTSIQLCSTNNNMIEGGSLKVYNSSWLCRELLYVGSGMSGNLVCVSACNVNAAN